jgi:hypothetical protein
MSHPNYLLRRQNRCCLDEQYLVLGKNNLALRRFVRAQPLGGS